MAWGTARGDEVTQRAMVGDESAEIAAQLATWCDRDAADLVLTTGGTGLSERDVTPEATRAVIEREAPGIAERIRALSLTSFPRTALSRGIAGVRLRTLIVNLPGSTSGVRDALAALEPIVNHGIDILRGAATDHSRATPSDRGGGSGGAADASARAERAGTTGGAARRDA